MWVMTRTSCGSETSRGRWIGERVARHDFGSRILPIDARVAELWGRLNVPDPLPTVDTLIAATALVHGLVLVTRNVKDVAATGVPVLNPFEGD